MARFTLVAAVFCECNGHGTINYPPPRNPSGTLWFTEGAAIGCDAPRHVSPMKWALPWPLGGFCKNQMEPTLTDPTFRTYTSSVKVTPWHAPGFAPVYSPCGLTAGGYEEHQENGDVPPPGFRPGFDGLGLPPLAQQPKVWPAGSKQEVWWSIAANHGGGYSYRLCPQSQPLTEECFQKHVLNFAGEESWIIYGGLNSKNRTEIRANRTREGTSPPGSQWTKVPIPSCAGAAGGGYGEKCDEPQFPTPVPGLWGNGPSNSCAGQPESGHTPAQLAWCSKKMAFNIVDLVEIPEDLPAGDYLLSFRWDCEQTPQIWSQCADITVTAPSVMV